MYAIVYFNWSGSKEEFKEARGTLEKVANKFDDVELMDILIPSSEWNYAALIKADNFESFTNYIKKTPNCPTNGTYAMNNVDSDPTCSNSGGGHILPT